MKWHITQYLHLIKGCLMFRNIFAGPINYQDGSVLAGAGEKPSLYDIWYTPQLLEGMTGDSGGN